MLILMLIEDNEDDVILTKRAIKKICPQCETDVLTDGQSGLECIFDIHCSKTIDLVLLDINLPKVNGLEILRRIKTDPQKVHIPVVILTSSTYEADRQKAKEYGADMYVVKPLGMKEFENEVKHILEKFLKL